MNQQDLVEIWRCIALDLEPHLWYIIDDTEEFSPSLREGVGLTQEQYGSLLLSSGIRVRKRRGLFGISTDPLNYLQTELRGQCAMNNTRIKLPDVEKGRYFISIGPAHSKIISCAYAILCIRAENCSNTETLRTKSNQHGRRGRR